MLLSYLTDLLTRISRLMDQVHLINFSRFSPNSSAFREYKTWTESAKNHSGCAISSIFGIVFYPTFAEIGGEFDRVGLKIL